MLEQITIENFKSFRKAELKLGRVNLLIGTNASGKSNFLGALRFLQGVASGFTVDEVLNGKPKGPTSDEWEGIRGGGKNVAFIPLGKANSKINQKIELKAQMLVREHLLELSLAITSPSLWLHRESFRADGADIYTTSSPNTGSNRRGKFCQKVTPPGPWREWEVSNDKTVLSELRQTHRATDKEQQLIDLCRQELSALQFLTPDPRELRNYTVAEHPQRIGTRGENFAGIVRAICADSRSKTAYVGWLKDLLPTELDNVETLEGARGDVMFALRHGKRLSHAGILSDGTLRFAAMAAAFFQPIPPWTLVFEDIEDGLHPTRLRLLLSLLTSQSKRIGAQVFATTHSPLAVDWARAFEDVKVFYFRRDEKTGESVVREIGAEATNGATLGELMSEGWLEAEA
jgi:predicted ATPase